MAAPASLPDARLWQTLLSVEANAARGRVLLQGLDPLFGDASDGLRNHSLLTATERKRAAIADYEALDRAVGNGVSVLTESEFPEHLAEADAYPGLFVHGDVSCLNRPTVGIVGTRNASAYGKACAHKFAEALARAGVTIVSGGALGIDAAAHRGALAADGSTVAVLASGVDYIYPPVHGGLFNQIRRKGCLVSQYAVGVKPADYRFLQRNDLIAALSQVLLIVEAPTRSGALRTSNASADLGREVFVVPANIDLQDFRGSFNLIRDGATLVYHPNQILEALGVEPVSGEAPVEPSASGGQILAHLSAVPTSAEKIVELTGMPTSEVLSELTMLELEGRVLRDAGGYALRP